MRVSIGDLDHAAIDVEQRVADAEGVELEHLHGGVDVGLDPRAKGTNALLVQYARVDAEVMDFLGPDLKVVGRYGVGVDTVDLDAAKERGIRVVNVPDYGAQSVADHAITLALAVARNLPMLERQARAGRTDLAPATPIHQFCDQTFGIVGYGSIGKAAAAKARGIGFRVQVCDPVIPEGCTECDGFAVVDLDTLLATSDIVSLHTPLIESTHHLIDAAAMEKMKDGAFLVNTARGGVVDNEALVQALTSGKLGGAGLDVFDPEPLPADAAIKSCDRVVLTPHSAFYSEESYLELKRRVIQNAIDVLKGRECANIVV